eukprot:scaffold108399_cov57-Phaeocystis_antarctica.AAC.1
MHRSSRAVAAPYTGHGYTYHCSSRAAPRHAGAARSLRQVPDTRQGEPQPLRPATPLAQPHPSPSHTLHPATHPLTTYHSPLIPPQAFEVVQRSVWAAMDDGTSEAEIFAIADK